MTRLILSCAVPAWVLVCAGQAAFGAVINTWHVPGDFGTIQSAIAAAAAGEMILVGPGDYRENIRFGGKDVSLQSTDGPEATVIRAVSDETVDIGPGGEIVGFTITGGNGSFAGAIDANGVGSLIKGNIIEYNGGRSSSPGVDGFVASPTIEDNIFRHNSCGTQYAEAVVNFANGSSPVIRNNVFADNDCAAISMLLPRGQSPKVINNTIVNNRVGIWMPRLYFSSPHDYRNNIIVGNEVGLLTDEDATVLPNWHSNLVFGNGTDYAGVADQTGVNGNISADPLFVNAASDYRLHRDSPAIDSGAATGAPPVDLLGVSRPADGDGDDFAQYDIGAYEYVPPIPSTVVGRHVFYNNSALDGNDLGANADDDGAIATDKTALSPGVPAGFENYTNFDGGINGIIIDVDRPSVSGSMNIADFQFRVGNNDDPSTWELAPGRSGASLRRGEGPGGSDRVMIVWTDGVIVNQWLEVTVKATDRTGLEADDVFYFGNAVGDVGNSAFYATVNDADFNAVSANYADPAGVENVFDVNRDGRVDPNDALIVRSNYTAGGAPMTMLWSPVPEPCGLTLAAFGLLGLLALGRRRRS